MPDDLIELVSGLIREVASTIVLPRFGHLTTDEVHLKAPGDTVTIADQEAERALTKGLTALLPGSEVVGEEAVAADPGVLRRLGDPGAVWVVDPVDGTNNFAAGETPFAVMVALLRDGEPAASWILDVVTDRMVVAEAGSGAYRNGERLRTRTDSPPAGELTGVVARKYLTAVLRKQVDANAHRLLRVGDGHHCAGYEYPAVVTDEQQFVLFWRILPWDHLPGSLIVREAGGTVRHLDGSDYRPADSERGLLVAANPGIWATARSTLFG